MFVRSESGTYVNLDRCDWVEVIQVADGGVPLAEWVVVCGVYDFPASAVELRKPRTSLILRTLSTEAEAQSYLDSLFTRNRFYFPGEPSCN